MTINSSNPIGLGALAAQNVSGTESAVKKAGSGDEQKLQKAAGDFESILLASMWKSMKQSFGSSETESDPAHGTLDDWGIEVMSGAVGKAGGLGIGRLILKHLDPAIRNHAGVTPGSDSPKLSSKEVDNKPNPLAHVAD